MEREGRSRLLNEFSRRRSLEGGGGGGGEGTCAPLIGHLRHPHSNPEREGAANAETLRGAKPNEAEFWPLQRSTLQGSPYLHLLRGSRRSGGARTASDLRLGRCSADASSPFLATAAFRGHAIMYCSTGAGIINGPRMSPFPLTQSCAHAPRE